jgi:integrase
MARTGKLTDIPGCIYKRGKRYYYRVKLPNSEQFQAFPLVTPGSVHATTDYKVACELARIEYKKLVFEANKPVQGKFDGSIGGLVQRYLAAVKGYYSKKEYDRIGWALKRFTDKHAAAKAEDFQPLELKAFRDGLIKDKLSRGVINAIAAIVKRMFKWAVSEQLCSVYTYQAIMTVEALKKNRSEAKEPAKVKAVDEKVVRAIMAHTTPVVAAMIELQMLTGMRSGELVIMRPCDVNRKGKIWQYVPASHKTAHHDHERKVAIGPKAQAILAPYLEREPEAYCFSPKESMAQRPVTVRGAIELVKDRYNTGSYRRAVHYAVEAAQKENDKLPHFFPHQLRHTAATKIRKHLGLDAARAALGQRSLGIADEYAEIDKGLAQKAAKKLG